MRPALLLLLAAAATSRARLRAPRFPRHDGDADIFVKLTAGDDRRYDSVYADDSSDGAPRRRVARAAEVLRAWLDGERGPLRRVRKRLGRSSPAAWLLAFAAARANVARKQERRAKRRELRLVRSLVDADDYHISIVTTAAMPWMTGTAVNPLLRAAHLAKAGKRVTLLVPWLHPEEQAFVFPAGLSFDAPAAQREHVERWLAERARLPMDFELKFYASRYDAARGSILPLGDLTRYFTDEESDVCVLEEPEHLNWYHHGRNWRSRFKLVVGIVHTNYIYYAQTSTGAQGPVLSRTLRAINVGMTRAYCDHVIKLSDTLQPLPRAVVCNVHGVRGDFLRVGRAAARPFHRWTGGAYFLGKVLWAKGHRLLLEYLMLQQARGDAPTHIDVYGGGEDLKDIKNAAIDAAVDLTFFPPTDHADPALRRYKVFVNPSRSEVLSTTTAEALAMGKFVVLERHPSNDFFVGFANALPYDTAEEFLSQLQHALASTPAPLTDDERRRLSWEGATDRLLAAIVGNTTTATAADLTLAGAAAASGRVRDDSLLPSLADKSVEWIHQGIQGLGLFGDGMRMASGAGPVSRQAGWLEKRMSQPELEAEVAQIVAESLAKTPPPPRPA